jgi:hypothetical protein
MSAEILRKMFDALSPEDKKEIMGEIMKDVTKRLTSTQAPEVDPVERNETERPVYKPQTRQAVVNEDFSVTPIENPKGHRTPVKAKTNQWSDTGESRDEEFDASKYEEIGRTPRTRQAPEIVDVECHVCKKMFTANVSTLYGTFHRCGRCVGR